MLAIGREGLDQLADVAGLPDAGPSPGLGFESCRRIIDCMQSNDGHSQLAPHAGIVSYCLRQQGNSPYGERQEDGKHYQLLCLPKTPSG
jgi:hypothetical protein